MTRHPQPIEVIKARRGLLNREQTAKVLAHFEKCDTCLARLVKYVDKSYGQAKDYLAFGVQEDLRKLGGVPAQIPDGLKRKIAAMGPSPATHVRKLAALLGKLQMADRNGMQALRWVEVRWQGKQLGLFGDKSIDGIADAWSQFLNGIEGYARAYDGFRKTYGQLPSRVLHVLQGADEPLKEVRWCWRTTAYAVDRSGRTRGLSEQQQFFLDLEEIAILIRIVVGRFRLEATQCPREDVPEIAVPDCVGPMLELCRVAIGKLNELAKARVVAAQTEEAFAGFGMPCRFVAVLGGKDASARAFLSEWLAAKMRGDRKGQGKERRGSDRGSFVEFPGYECLLPEVLGIVKTRRGNLRLMVEVSYEIQPDDVELAARILRATHIDRAILVSRAPLSRIRKRMRRRLNACRDASGRQVIQIAEWDEGLGRFTDFFPGRSFRSVVAR